MLRRIKSVLEVTWRRCCDISRASWMLLEEDVVTYQERLGSHLKKKLQHSNVATSLKRRRKNVITPPRTPPKTHHLQKWQVPPIERRHQKRARGTRWLPTGDNLGGNPVPLADVDFSRNVLCNRNLLPILDKLCHNLADWTVWQFWDQIVTPILTIHASDLALWGRYNLSRLSALNPNNKKTNADWDWYIIGQKPYSKSISLW